MIELHEIADPYENEIERDAFWEGEEDTFLLRIGERRPEIPPLRCPHPGCNGQLYPEADIPGLVNLYCLLCSRLIGEVLESDLAAWAGQDAVQRVRDGSLSFLWVREASADVA